MNMNDNTKRYDDKISGFPWALLWNYNLCYTPWSFLQTSCCAKHCVIGDAHTQHTISDGWNVLLSSSSQLCEQRYHPTHLTCYDAFLKYDENDAAPVRIALMTSLHFLLWSFALLPPFLNWSGFSFHIVLHSTAGWHNKLFASEGAATSSEVHFQLHLPTPPYLFPLCHMMNFYLVRVYESTRWYE